MIDSPRVAPDADRGRGRRGLTAVPPDLVQGPGTLDHLERGGRPQAEGWPVGPVDRLQVAGPDRVRVGGIEDLDPGPFQAGRGPPATRAPRRAAGQRGSPRSRVRGVGPRDGPTGAPPGTRARRRRSARCPARRQSSRNPRPGRRAGARSTSARRCPGARRPRARQWRRPLPPEPARTRRSACARRAPGAHAVAVRPSDDVPRTWASAARARSASASTSSMGGTWSSHSTSVGRAPKRRTASR